MKLPNSQKHTVLLAALVRLRVPVALAAAVAALLLVLVVPNAGLLLLAPAVGGAVYGLLLAAERTQAAHELTGALAEERTRAADLTARLADAEAKTKDLWAELEKVRAIHANDEKALRDTRVRMEKLSEKLLAVTKELDTVGRTKSEFMARMSHELRTPLNAIVGYSELVLDGIYGDLTDTQRDRLERILRNGRSLLGLINDILDLSNIDAGHLELTFTNVKVDNALRLALASVEQQAKDKGLSIGLELDGDLPPIHADELRFRQMLVNLLENAVKFTEEGEINLWAGFAHVERHNQLPYPELEIGDWLVVRVSDTGIGIPTKLHHKVFGDFVQADTSATREYGGTGLGLTITRRLIELHGGKIWLEESAPGKGSTFAFGIPYEIRKPVEEVTMSTTSTTSDLPLILVVDDEEDTRDIIGTYLQQRSYEVAFADGGKRGLALAKQLKPDVMILDLLMPDMDGWEVLERMQENPQTANIAVVIISIMDNSLRAMKRGAVEYVSKPIDRALLLEATARAVSHRARPPVLIAAEVEPVRNTFAAVIRIAGHKVIAAQKAEAAIQWLQEHRAGLVLLGFEDPSEIERVLAFMRNHPESMKSPILVVSNPETIDKIQAGGLVYTLNRRGLTQTSLMKAFQDAVSEKVPSEGG